MERSRYMQSAGLIVTGGRGGMGVSWISIHNGGGAGTGYSPRAGMIVVADAATTLAYKSTQLFQSTYRFTRQDLLD
jgi:urocanate hydratase